MTISMDEIKAAFVKVTNRIITDREFYLTELNSLLEELGDTTELEAERKMLDEQMSVTAKTATDMIAKNARIAQNQSDYNEKYEAVIRRYEEMRQKRDAIKERVGEVSSRPRKLEMFIETIKDLPELFTEFDIGVWAAMVESVTVYSKQRMVFRLTCGMEVEGGI